MIALTDELRQVIGQLQALNDTNKKLIEQSLQFIRTSIEVLSESPQVPTYGGTGESNAPYASGKTSYFDSKA
ncbi:MAG: flagellar export chaperone FlgN, partial [Tumebacillaceae bacterium]